MRKALFILPEPPPTNGVMAIEYARVSSHVPSCGWQFHFLGPDPRRNSPYPPLRDFPEELSHYAGDINLSRRSSVERNRNRGIRRVLWSVVRGMCVVTEKLFPSTGQHTERRTQALIERGLRLTASHRFDLVVGTIPDLAFAQAAAALSAGTGLPLVLHYHDPLGHRARNGFTPTFVDAQRALFEQAAGVIFASPMTMQRYREQGFIHPRTRAITYSFEPAGAETAAPAPSGASARELTLSHIGSLAPWRPIRTLVNAIAEFNRNSVVRIRLTQIGYMDRDSDRYARTHLQPGRDLIVEPTKPHREAAAAALHSDVLLVVIGPRHADNIPAKFIEYLGYNKPVLVVGPKGSVVEAMLRQLGVGSYADIDSTDAIRDALTCLTNDYEEFARMTRKNSIQIDYYCAERVAERWCDFLDSIAG